MNFLSVVEVFSLKQDQKDQFDLYLEKNYYLDGIDMQYSTKSCLALCIPLSGHVSLCRSFLIILRKRHWSLSLGTILKIFC